MIATALPISSSTRSGSCWKSLCILTSMRRMALEARTLLTSMMPMQLLHYRPKTHYSMAPIMSFTLPVSDNSVGFPITVRSRIANSNPQASMVNAQPFLLRLGASFSMRSLTSQQISLQMRQIRLLLRRHWCRMSR